MGLRAEFRAVEEFLDMKFRYQRSCDKSHCSPFYEVRLCFRMACAMVLYSNLPSFKDFSPKYIQLLEKPLLTICLRNFSDNYSLHLIDNLLGNSIRAAKG